MRYDIAVIGTGPAGLSATLTAVARGKNVVVFGNELISQKVSVAHTVSNYLGIPSASGSDIAKIFTEQIKSAGIEVINSKIDAVYSYGEYFALQVADVIYEATTVIVATGVSQKASVANEAKLLGRGISYCATCDGMLYKGKDVMVISYAKHAESEAMFLASVANKVYYLPLYEESVGVSGEKFEIIGGQPKSAVGENKLESVIVGEREIAVDALFILKDIASPQQLVPGVDMDGKHIKVDRLMRTNIAGCFAAGDVVGQPYQYIKSAGEGNIATLSAVEYLDK